MQKQILRLKSFLKIKRLKWLIQNLGFKKILLFSYILGLIVGIVLAFLGVFFPFLQTCFTLFGESFCTSTGVFLILLTTLPGYLFIGKLFYGLSQVPWLISFIAVIVFSGFFYFLIGFFIDKIRMNKATTEVVTKYIIYISFIFLLVFLLILL